ncbi:MAG: hypothetical protein A3F72_21590 [Bacteroidetes bacterium RIFCSPLOWO2_12_FULL_35_15]|nr:MAG: hypothetical protein A3F72_21590 [Bacteroidetes bacterium RIFCSPLOWO2_12_FULL_35_15]
MKTTNYLFAIFFLTFSNYLIGQTELLDPSFDTDGMVTTDLGGDVDLIYSVAIQSDSKIVAIGTAKIGGVNRFGLVRYNIDGSLDASFGTGGIVTTSIGAQDGATAVAIQSDGKIVAGGYTFGATLDFAVVRYNTDGSLDLTFDGDGKAIAGVGTGNDLARTMLIQPDGKIVLAGKSIVGSVGNFGLARFNSDGSLDNTFDSDGVLTTALGTNSADAADALSVKIQSNGKIVVTGDFTPNNGPDGLPLVRYNTDGSLDNTFGTGGKIITYIGRSFNNGKAMAIQPDGQIVVASESDTINSPTQDDFVVLRYNTDGTPDNTFGANGITISDLYGGDDRPAAMLLQPDGKIIVAGFTWLPSEFYPDFTVARYLSNGTLDNTFGTGGSVWTDMGTGTNTSSAVALAPDGKIVVGGAVNAGLATSDFAIARYNADLSTKVNEINSASAIQIYPNPGTGKFQLKINDLKSSKDAKLEIYNSIGAIVLKQQITNEINLSNSPKGIYFVKIIDGSTIFSSKIVVQ